MTDIAWLLRNDVPCGAGVCCAGELCNQAAEEIERLRAALREIAEHTTNPEGSGPAYGMVGKLVRIARAALEVK